MATRAAATTDWRAAWRRAMRRAAQMIGAGLLAVTLIVLTLSLASYTQTDPSPSTAASPDRIANWMGATGAWAAERTLLAFGLTALLLLPLLYIGARYLWRAVELDEEETSTPWWRPFLLLILAMVLLASVLSLVFDATSLGALPAGPGGLSGLLGAGAMEAVANRISADFSGWITGLLGLVAAMAGLGAVARVFAIDWGALFTLPDFAHRLRLPRFARDKAPSADTDVPVRPASERQQRAARAAEPIEAAPARRAPDIPDPVAQPRPAAASKPKQQDMFAEYALPSLDLLEDPSDTDIPKLDRDALQANARLLENVLDDFNVKGEITAVRAGPVVTMYELEPAPGIKASRVVGLAEDIARNMSAISARVSPIPGRTVIGIELPNAKRQTVSFKELASSADFAEAKGNLPIILGKNIAGEPIVADLAAMPHLLVAGTTGSGKSVGLNCILLSLLYRFTPAECRLILIDPKVLELKSYDDIPHLLSQVVVEPHKSVRALKWAVGEMEKRYRMMSSVNSRNINSFNEKVRNAQLKGTPLGRRVQTGFDPETGEELYEEEQLDYEVLPQIVLIVDELADLMVTVGKEIEVLIQRLSQKSRAAGIHLIMATQRPSVDVITGVIKANLPTRISFKVTSRIDSRVVLGEQGAEQLLGAGDMLYMKGGGRISRVHGPFVEDGEVEDVVNHLKSFGAPDYLDEVTMDEEEMAAASSGPLLPGATGDPDDPYDQALGVILRDGKASTSYIQRRLGIGYNRAASIIEEMEKKGIVGPANHAGKREILIDRAA